MTNPNYTTTVYHEIPSSSSAETKKRQPSPAEALALAVYLDDERFKAYMHVTVSITILAFFSIAAVQLWQDLGHWHAVVITTIVFLYLGVMMNLLLIKRRNDQRRELEASEWIIRGVEWTPTLMSVATGVMLVSLGAAVFIFGPDWNDLAWVALWISASTAAIFILLKIGEIEQKKALMEKREDASDLV